MSVRILVVEDDAKTIEYLRQGLVEQGYVVDSAEDGTAGLRMATANDYDLVILDVMLPGIDGWDVLQELRSIKQTPVLMLTARSSTEDKVRGLDFGADDYLLKPFQFPELLARVRSTSRRGNRPVIADALELSDLKLDPARHRAYRDGIRIDLTPKEFALLHLLMRRRGEVLSRTQIASLVWDINFDSDTNVVEVAVRRLRSKVDDPFDRKLIHTIRGVGYVLEERAK